MSIPSRDEAYALLTEYTSSDNLIKHALSVEAAMGFYAKKFDADEDRWRALALLHDFDYDRYPSLDDHPFKGAEILRGRGVDEDFIEAILSHADHTGVPRDTLERKALFAVDELCGFITAVALVRPSKKVEDVKVKSVKKKMKDKAFARAVKREDITAGAEAIGLGLDEHIDNVIVSMRSVAPQLGL